VVWIGIFLRGIYVVVNYEFGSFKSFWVVWVCFFWMFWVWLGLLVCIGGMLLWVGGLVGVGWFGVGVWLGGMLFCCRK
jgi:hypothetical protein